MPGNSQDDITNVYAQQKSIFVIRFKTAVDSVTALDISRYVIDKGVNAGRALIKDPEVRTVVLISDSALTDTSYQVQINGVKLHGILNDSVLTTSEAKVVDYDW